MAFHSYVQPFVVLAAIPFGIVGAVPGHILLGFDLSLISFMGVIALSGVVVNDSLIMLDHANRLVAQGASPFKAIHQSGLRRFHPIILTTVTTFGGLTPIILERSMQAQHLIPMAISLGFGIVFAVHHSFASALPLPDVGRSQGVHDRAFRSRGHRSDDLQGPGTNLSSTMRWNGAA